MSEMRFLLDENLDPSIRVALRQRSSEIVVWMVGDPGAPKKGTSDPDILLWCEAGNFSLVTNNRVSMPIHLRDHLASDRHIPGLFILRRYMRLRDVVDALELIWGASEAEEYLDLMRYLPIR